jgi:hypothetical protein
LRSLSAYTVEVAYIFVNCLVFLYLLRGKLHCVLGSHLAQMYFIFAENDKNVVESFLSHRNIAKRGLCGYPVTKTIFKRLIRHGILQCYGSEIIFPDPDPTYRVIPDQYPTYRIPNVDNTSKHLIVQHR